jgi:hypothetical protein
MDLSGHEELLGEMQAVCEKLVLDGPVVSSRYAAAPLRILWILREPNGEGPWDLREFLSTPQNVFSYSRWSATIGLVAKVSYGLTHGAIPWGPWGNDARSCTEALADVAVININKRGGVSSVDWELLLRASSDFGDFIVRQVALLEPHVAIMAGTFPLLPRPLREALHILGDAEHCSSRVGNTVWIRTYHPNQRRIPHRDYYETVRRSLDSAYGSHARASSLALRRSTQ